MGHRSNSTHGDDLCYKIRITNNCGPHVDLSVKQAGVKSFVKSC